MPKIELSTGKTLEVKDRQDVASEYKALKLCGATAQAGAGGDAKVSLAEGMLTGFAYTFVMVVSVDGKPAADLTDGTSGEDILLSFRAKFTDGEWAEIEAALDQIDPPKDPKAPVGKYRIIST